MLRIQFFVLVFRVTIKVFWLKVIEIGIIFGIEIRDYHVLGLGVRG